MNNILTIFILFFSCAYIGEAFAEKQIKDSELVIILSSVVIEQELRTDNFVFRALSLQNNGECDGNPISCPLKRFFLVASTIEEYPDVAVYELEPSYDWVFTSIKQIDSLNEYENRLHVTLEQESLIANSHKILTNKRNVNLEINPWGLLKRIEIKGYGDI